MMMVLQKQNPAPSSGVLFVMRLTNPFVRRPTDMPIAGN
jgi:hypothetical protein